jgi:hypothetical protein
MGLKATFDAASRTIQLIEAPDANGDVSISVKQDLYSDGKEDWVASELLRKMEFPIRTTGGDSIPGQKFTGDYYFLRSDWKIKPFESDQRLAMVGNLFSEDGTDTVLATIGAYSAKVVFEVSPLTQTVSAGSGLSPEQSTQLTNIDAKTDYQVKIIDNRRILIKQGATWHLRVFDDDDSTPILDKELKDIAGNDISDIAAGILAQELATSV